jgi:hypothetical protein
MEILLQLSEDLGRLSRQAEELGLREIPPVVVTGIEEVKQDQNTYEEEGIESRVQSIASRTTTKRPYQIAALGSDAREETQGAEPKMDEDVGILEVSGEKIGNQAEKSENHT